jgi:hypothetical protein
MAREYIKRGGLLTPIGDTQGKMDPSALLGIYRLPQEFELYLLQYGFATIPIEAQNMFESLAGRPVCYYATAISASIPYWPASTAYGVVTFSSRRNVGTELLGELFVTLRAYSELGTEVYEGLWDKPRPGEGNRAWKGWKRVITNRDFIDSWVNIPLTLDKITDLGVSWVRFNPATQFLSVRLEEAVINACSIGMRLATFTLPGTAVSPGSRRYRGMICISPPPANYRGSSGLDIQITGTAGYLYLYPMDYDTGANDAPLPHWDGSHLYGNVTVSLISG